MAELIWHKIEDGLPPKPDTPFEVYLVWWAYFDNGYSGVPGVTQFSSDRMEFLVNQLIGFEPGFHKITHWASVIKPMFKGHDNA